MIPSPKLAETMRAAGVIGKPELYFWRVPSA
jgi:hypothetical protein